MRPICIHCLFNKPNSTFFQNIQIQLEYILRRCVYAFDFIIDRFWMCKNIHHPRNCETKIGTDRTEEYWLRVQESVEEEEETGKLLESIRNFCRELKSRRGLEKEEQRLTKSRWITIWFLRDSGNSKEGQKRFRMRYEFLSRVWPILDRNKIYSS